MAKINWGEIVVYAIGIGAILFTVIMILVAALK